MAVQYRDGFGPGFLYLAKCGSLYKVGFTTDPVSRARKLRNFDGGCNYSFVSEQRAAGHIPEIIHLIWVDHMRQTESFVHELFRPYQMQPRCGYTQPSEWFCLPVESVAWFCSRIREDQLQ